MNIIFHTTAALGIIATINNTQNSIVSKRTKILHALTAFVVGVISHGALDYIPHCYPINPKIDVTLAATIMAMLLFFSNSKYRLMVALTFLGSIFPDIIDLSPQILNKYVGTSIPLYDKIFPWHFEKYSGSIFIDDCKTSALNHFILVFVVSIICLKRKDEVIKIFTR